MFFQFSFDIGFQLLYSNAASLVDFFFFFSCFALQLQSLAAEPRRDAALRLSCVDLQVLTGFVLKTVGTSRLFAHSQKGSGSVYPQDLTFLEHHPDFPAMLNLKLNLTVH